MKVFLQNAINLAYLADHQQWTWNRDGALSFRSTQVARQRCRSERLKDMVLIVCYCDGHAPYDVRIGVEDGQDAPVSAEVGRSRTVISTIFQSAK